MPPPAVPGEPVTEPLRRGGLPKSQVRPRGPMPAACGRTGPPPAPPMPVPEPGFTPFGHAPDAAADANARPIGPPKWGRLKVPRSNSVCARLRDLHRSRPMTAAHSQVIPRLRPCPSRLRRCRCRRSPFLRQCVRTTTAASTGRSRGGADAGTCERCAGRSGAQYPAAAGEAGAARPVRPLPNYDKLPPNIAASLQRLAGVAPTKPDSDAAE